MILDEKNYALSYATNVQEAIDTCQKQTFDIIITDLHMPGASGIELIEKASQFEPKPGLIVISGTDIESLLTKSKELGATALSKPIVDEEVYRAIEDLIVARQELKEAS